MDKQKKISWRNKVCTFLPCCVLSLILLRIGVSILCSIDVILMYLHFFYDNRFPCVWSLLRGPFPFLAADLIKLMPQKGTFHIVSYFLGGQ